MKTLISLLLFFLTFNLLLFAQRGSNNDRNNTGERNERIRDENPVRNPNLDRQNVKSPERTKPTDTNTPQTPPPNNNPPAPIDHNPVGPILIPPHCPIPDPPSPIIIDGPIIIDEPNVEHSLNNLPLPEVYDLGVSRLNNELYSESIDYFNILLENDPLDYEVYCLRGRAYHGLEMYDRARKDFKVSLKVDSTYAESYYYLGITELQLGNKSEAQIDFELASEYGLEKADIILRKYFSY